MEKVSIGVLKQIIDKLPDDYVVKFNNGKRDYSLGDKLEINISEKEIIFHKF